MGAWTCSGCYQYAYCLAHLNQDTLLSNATTSDLSTCIHDGIASEAGEVALPQNQRRAGAQAVPEHALIVLVLDTTYSNSRYRLFTNVG